MKPQILGKSIPYDFEVKTATLHANAFNDRLVAPGHKAIVAMLPSGPTILSTVSSKYNLIPNADVVNSVEEALTDAGYNFTTNHVVTKNGAKLYSIYNFPDLEENVDPEVGDDVNMQLVLTNSYDGSMKVGFYLGVLRLICTNGLVRMDKQFVFGQKHTNRFSMEEIIQRAKEATDYYHMNVLGFYKLLQSCPIKTSEGLKIVQDIIEKKVFPEKYENDAKELWINPANKIEARRNLWTLFNVFTNIITHKVIAEKQKQERAMMLHASINRYFNNKVG